MWEDELGTVVALLTSSPHEHVSGLSRLLLYTPFRIFGFLDVGLLLFSRPEYPAVVEVSEEGEKTPQRRNLELLYTIEIHYLPPFSYSLSSDPPFSGFTFRFSFFSFFFRFRSARSSAVSPSCRFRFLDSPPVPLTVSGGTSTPICAPAVAASASAVTVGAGGISDLTVGAWMVPFSNGALKSLYSAFHFAGVSSLGRPYFCSGLAPKPLIFLPTETACAYIKLSI